MVFLVAEAKLLCKLACFVFACWCGGGTACWVLGWAPLRRQKLRIAEREEVREGFV